MHQSAWTVVWLGVVIVAMAAMQMFGGFEPCSGRCAGVEARASRPAVAPGVPMRLAAATPTTKAVPAVAGSQGRAASLR